MTEKALLSTDPKERKKIPLAGGVFDYFTAALIEVAKVSQAGNDQHNPGQPLHWSRGKSADHPDTMLRHFAERGTTDTDGLLHSAKMVWRALAILQLECEAAGAPVARGAVTVVTKNDDKTFHTIQDILDEQMRENKIKRDAIVARHNDVSGVYGQV